MAQGVELRSFEYTEILFVNNLMFICCLFLVECMIPVSEILRGD